MWGGGGGRPARDASIGGTAAMVQLAPGVRMDTETLDQALHVAEVAAKQGGQSFAPAAVSSAPAGVAAAHIPSQLAATSRRAAIDVLDESGLGFDIYEAHGSAPRIGWGAEPGADEGNVMTDSPLPRPPTFFVHVDTDSAGRGALISVGLTVNLVPAVGVIYDVDADKIYSARAGRSITVNGQKLSGTKAANERQGLKEKSVAAVTSAVLDGGVVCSNISVPDDTERNNYSEHIACTIRNLLDAGHYGLRIEGSAARCLLMVAVGDSVGYFGCGPKASEVCAGLVLVRAMGGITANLGDKSDSSVMSPIAQTLLAAERAAGSVGDGLPHCDLGARRFLCCGSLDVHIALEPLVAGPFPYAVDDEEHPYAEDLVMKKVVLGVDPEESNTEIRGDLIGLTRWSETPATTYGHDVVDAPLPVLVPKGGRAMFGTLRRKGKLQQQTVAMVEFEPSPLPERPRPLSRREWDIQRMEAAMERAAVGQDSGDLPAGVPVEVPTTVEHISPGDAEFNAVHDELVSAGEQGQGNTDHRWSEPELIGEQLNESYADQYARP